MLEGVLKRIEEEVCFPLSSLLFGFVYLAYVWSRGWKRLLGFFFFFGIRSYLQDADFTDSWVPLQS